MDFGLGTYGLSFAAGGLSTLSPCVLPLVPVLIASAAAQHRLGPVALASGLTLSFASMGVALATVGMSLGLDSSLMRTLAAAALIVFGVLLLSTRLQQQLAGALSGLSSAGEGLLSRFALNGLHGQFFLGLMLGVVWSPCVGPTLGAAMTLASQGRDLAQVSVVMLSFGLGASAPLIALGLVSRAALQRWRGRLFAAGQRGKWLLGAALLLMGLLVLTGWDKQLEAWTLDHAPTWLGDLGTRI